MFPLFLLTSFASSVLPGRRPRNVPFGTLLARFRAGATALNDGAFGALLAPFVTKAKCARALARSLSHMSNKCPVEHVVEAVTTQVGSADRVHFLRVFFVIGLTSFFGVAFASCFLIGD